MAKLKLTLPSEELAVTGKQVTFVSPCDSGGLTHIIIQDKEFALVDSNDNSIIDGAFTKNTAVSVILNVEEGKAFVQNADINKKIEDFVNSKVGKSNSVWQYPKDKYYIESPIDTEHSYMRVSKVYGQSSIVKSKNILNIVETKKGTPFYGELTTLSKGAIKFNVTSNVYSNVTASSKLDINDFKVNESYCFSLKDPVPSDWDIRLTLIIDGSTAKSYYPGVIFNFPKKVTQVFILYNASYAEVGTYIICPMINKGTTKLPYESPESSLRSAKLTAIKTYAPNFFDENSVSYVIRNNGDYLLYPGEQNGYVSGVLTDRCLVSAKSKQSFPTIWQPFSMKLKAGTYTVSADCYIPTGGAPNTEVYLGLSNLPPDYPNNRSFEFKSVFLPSFDEWHRVSVKLTISESIYPDFYITLQGGGTDEFKYNLDVRFKNITVTNTDSDEYIPFEALRDTTLPDSLLSAEGNGLGIEDERNCLDLGSMKINLKVIRVVFDGTEEWTVSNGVAYYESFYNFLDPKVKYKYHMLTTEGKVKILGLCNEYECETVSETDSTYEELKRGIYPRNNFMGYTTDFAIRDDEFATTPELWKEHLATLWKLGKPLTIDYVIDKEPFGPLGLSYGNIETDVSRCLSFNPLLEIPRGHYAVLETESDMAVESELEFFEGNTTIIEDKDGNPVEIPNRIGYYEFIGKLIGEACYARNAGYAHCDSDGNVISDHYAPKPIVSTEDIIAGTTPLAEGQSYHIYE